LIVAHLGCRCWVYANARYAATNSCTKQGSSNCLATGFVAYGAGVERQGAPGREKQFGTVGSPPGIHAMPLLPLAWT
jgi:hypothetical protein